MKRDTGSLPLQDNIPSIIPT